MTRLHLSPAPLPGPLLLAFLFVLSACSGPRAGTDTDPVPTPETDPEPVAIEYANYEDFDPSAYEEPPLGAAREVEHDVPASLLENRVSAGTVRTLRGFRIQVFQTLEKSDAIRTEEEVKAWWASVREDHPQLFSETLPVYINYRQPYYRVRIGNFSSRYRAQQAAREVQKRFPNASVVPDLVSIRQ